MGLFRQDYTQINRIVSFGNQPISPAGHIISNNKEEYFSSAEELGEILLNDVRFGQCFTTHMVRYAYSRSKAEIKADILDEAYRSFLDNSGNLKLMVSDILKSKNFNTIGDE